MTRERQRAGVEGERRAERALRRLGMTILERRFRTRCGEIDLIARDGETLVFVEVKARRALGFGTVEAVTPAKRRRIARVAASYLARRDAAGAVCRFDVVEVLPEAEPRVIVDAFRLWPTG